MGRGMAIRQEEGWYEEASYKPGAGHEEASTEPGLLYQSLNNNETSQSLTPSTQTAQN
jgi:hypothetical protein